MKAVITGFMPFNQERINPSWEAVQALPDTIAGIDLIKRQLPVEFEQIRPILQNLLFKEKPDLVLCTGQAGGRKAVCVEKVGINWRDARIADMAGFQPVDEPILPSGPVAYFSSLPVKAIQQAIAALGIEAKVSCSAGSFVCNETLYTLMDLLEKEQRPVLGGFIHVPYAPEQMAGKEEGTPSMALSDMSLALAAAIETIAAGIETRKPEASGKNTEIKQ